MNLGDRYRTLTAANIPTLSMQIGLCDGGYVGANDHPDSFISNNTTIGMESETRSGDTSDRSPQKGYVNSTLVRYYNASPARFELLQPSYTAYIWERVS